MHNYIQNYYRKLFHIFLYYIHYLQRPPFQYFCDELFHIFAKVMTSFSDKINAYFDLTNRSSSIFQEVRAGVTCFLTMSYILLVNPQVLSKVGILPTDIGRYVTLMFVVLFMIYDLRFTIYDLRFIPLMRCGV